jgi:hypothetical protein
MRRSLLHPVLILEDTSLSMRLWQRKVGALVEGLLRRGIPMERWYFDGFPDRVSRTRFGEFEPIEKLARRCSAWPLLVISNGGVVGAPGREPDEWSRHLTRWGSRIWIHPVSDPSQWSPLLRRLPVRVRPLSRDGILAAARDLERRDEALSETASPAARPVKREDVRRLANLVRLIPGATAEDVEAARQEFCPEVPDHVVAPVLAAVSGDATAGRTQTMTPTDEREARSYYLKVLERSEPPPGSAAHLRWRLECAVQRLKLGAGGGGDRRTVVDEIEDLARSPVGEEVDRALAHLTREPKGTAGGLRFHAELRRELGRVAGRARRRRKQPKAPRWKRRRAFVGIFLFVSITAVMLWVLLSSRKKGRDEALSTLCRRHVDLFAPERPASVPIEQYRLAQEQECDVCHDQRYRAPMSKCAACHGELMKAQHPFRMEPDPRPNLGKVNREWREDHCVECHVEHRGSGSRRGGFIPDVEETVGACARCHGGTDLEERGYIASLPPIPVDTWQRRYSAYSFGHDEHVTVLHAETREPMSCTFCHQEIPEARREAEMGGEETDLLRKDFLAVPFDTCARCHVQRRGPDGKPVDERHVDWKGWWPRKQEEKTGPLANVWTVNWHGGVDSDKNCTKCHQEVFQGPLREVRRLEVTPSQYSSVKARYLVDRRSHRGEFHEQDSKGGACTTCHLREVPLLTRKVEAVFWHAVHVDAGSALAAPVDKLSLSAECLKCHSDRSESSGLVNYDSAGLFKWAPKSCSAECHVEETSPDTGGRQLQPEPRPSAESDIDTVIVIWDFPHKHHLDFRHETLKDGCFTCHSFEAVAGGASSQLVPRTITEMRDCQTCHSRHANVGGGACEKCHPMQVGREELYNDFLGPNPPPSRSFLTKTWPEPNYFNHFSPGHDGQPCDICHQVGRGSAEKDLAQAGSLRDTPIPDESDKACRDCHLAKKQRFHWR